MQRKVKSILFQIIICDFLSVLGAFLVYRYYSVHHIGDSDYYWHIMLGQNIVNHSSADMLWSNDLYHSAYTNYSALADMLLYRLSSISSANETVGAYIYMVLSAFLLSLVVFVGYGTQTITALSNKRKPRFFIAATIITLCLLLLYGAKGNPRPHLIALMLFALANRLLTSSRPVALLGLLPISILWANLHGASFPMLIVLQIAYIVIGAVPVTAINSISFNKLPRQELYCRLFILFGSCIVAIINPAGISIYTRLLRVSDNANIISIAEWQPANIIKSPAVAILLLVLLYCIFAKSKITISSLVPLATTAVMTLYHVRFESWFFVSTAIFLLSNFPEQNDSDCCCSLYKCILSALGLVGSIAMIACIVSKPLNNIRPIRYPSDTLIATINDYSPRRMYTDINTGAFFEYNNIPAFVDSRIDMFNENLLYDINTLKGKVSITDSTLDYTDTMLSKYNFDMVTLCRGDSMMLIGYMSQRKDWTLLYADSAYVVFVPVIH